ncbi:MAG: TetR family transcriptional regulator [Rhizobiales bacterium]|nr:TetR family transcriptional regulator [Hyphomicrobiales bacterium]MBA67823.1 TetR family transcriptional regulator [Hyphomicrobiales bacterium]
MSATAPAALQPRKRPRRARAVATVDAIFEATIQLLLSGGLSRLTTTRVAERAGVSVGTMYQYFPHKQALIYGLNARYLEALAERIEAACRACHGARVDEMVRLLIETYWRAKTERADVTRALYLSVAGMDNSALIDEFARRADDATMAMLQTAADARFANIELVNRTLVTVVFGTVRNAFERNLEGARADAVRAELIRMCRAYLREAASSP